MIKIFRTKCYEQDATYMLDITKLYTQTIAISGHMWSQKSMTCLSVIITIISIMLSSTVHHQHSAHIGIVSAVFTVFKYPVIPVNQYNGGK